MENQPWTLERRLCGHNQKLRPKHATNLSYQEACRHGIDTATGTLSIQPCKSFYLCTKVWPGIIGLRALSTIVGGAIPLHISTKSQRFWEIQVFTTMFKTLFCTPTLHDMIHSLPTSDPSPSSRLIASSVAASLHPLPCVRHPPSSSVIQAQYPL